MTRVSEWATTRPQYAPDAERPGAFGDFDQADAEGAEGEKISQMAQEMAKNGV